MRHAYRRLDILMDGLCVRPVPQSFLKIEGHLDGNKPVLSGCRFLLRTPPPNLRFSRCFLLSRPKMLVCRLVVAVVEVKRSQCARYSFQHCSDLLVDPWTIGNIIVLTWNCMTSGHFTNARPIPAKIKRALNISSLMERAFTSDRLFVLRGDCIRSLSYAEYKQPHADIQKRLDQLVQPTLKSD